MDRPKERVCNNFIAIPIISDFLPVAVDRLQDDGFLFSIVPTNSAINKFRNDTYPVLTGGICHGFEVATGLVILRWTNEVPEIERRLKTQEVDLIRYYGMGGIIRPKTREHPFELVDRLS